MSRLEKLINKAKNYGSYVMHGIIVEIHSNNFALISGCARLVDYKSDRIVIDLGTMTLEIEGMDLEPESLVNGQMAVKGCIAAVKYEIH